MANCGRVYFGLRGDFVPEDLTEAIGIDPTSTATAGERIPGKVPKCSHWDYSSERVEGEYVDVNDLSRKIVHDLSPYCDRIVEAIKKWSLTAWFEVVLVFASDESISTPAIGFEPDVITFLHRVGATIDIDTYIDSADDSPPQD